jgi:hypothetical protein
MDRHITDKARLRTDATRLREYLRLDQSDRRHPAFDALHRKPHGASARKVVEYARIEREELA